MLQAVFLQTKKAALPFNHHVIAAPLAQALDSAMCEALRFQYGAFALQKGQPESYCVASLVRLPLLSRKESHIVILAEANMIFQGKRASQGL